MSHRDGLLCVGGPRHGAWVAYPEPVMIVVGSGKTEWENVKRFDLGARPIAVNAWKYGKYRAQDIAFPAARENQEVWVWEGWDE